MGLRFGRSITILPGVRLNLGMKGASLTLGVPGASVNLGSRGAHATVGLPGTGLSYRAPLGARRREHQVDEPEGLQLALQGDDVVVTDRAGARLPPEIEADILRRTREEVQNLVAAEIARRNVPEPVPSRHALPPPEPKPTALPGETRSDWVTRVAAWRARSANEAETRLVSCLETIAWERRTDMSCALSNGRVLMDVDLPEIEDMPAARWRARSRTEHPGLRQEPIPASERQRLYAADVARSVRRILDAVFEDLPDIGACAVNAYTTRGGRDDYVCVVDARRSSWLVERDEADDEIALARIGARMELTSTGRLRPQTPITT